MLRILRSRMNTPSNSKSIIVPLVLAAVLGGGVAAGRRTRPADGGGATHTTTVIRQPAVSAQGANNSRANAAEGLTAADIYQRYAPGVVYVRSEIIPQSYNPFDTFGAPQ